VAGNFRVNGTLNNNSNMALAVLNGVSTQDVRVDADVNMSAGVPAFSGLVARYTGPGDSNYYYADVTGNGGTLTARIFRNLGGSFTQLASANLTSASGTLRFEVVGNTQKLLLDDGSGFKLVASANDTVLNGPGSVGVRAVGAVNAVTYDNFQASEVVPTNASLPYTQAFNATADKQLGSEWTVQAGNFIVNGNLTKDTGLAIATLNGINAANMTITSLAFGSGNSVMLLGRYSGTGEGTGGYTAEMTATPGLASSVTVNIFRINSNGTLTLLKTGTTTNNSGTLEFDLSGTSLTLKLGSTTLLTATDSMFASGTAGVRLAGTAGTVSIDNFSVTSP
jgi:hypothetical protein